MNPTPISAAETIASLCRQFYDLGWVSGTGGGISIRDGKQIWMAPSGVQKERMKKEDMFCLSEEGAVACSPQNPSLKLTECAPLFMAAYAKRQAGGVIHSHSVNAVLASMLSEKEFRITEFEMIKGIEGHGYYDELIVPIVDNTAHEKDLTESLEKAIDEYPKTFAVLVRRHGVYVWGRNWQQAKTHAECYDQLFETSIKLKNLDL